MNGIDVGSAGLAGLSGAGLALLLQFLRGAFGVSGERAGQIVVAFGFVFFLGNFAIAGLSGLPFSLAAYATVFSNGLIQGLSFIFSAEGLYQKILNAQNTK